MRDPGSTPRRAVRRAIIRLILALPTWAWAQDFGFRPPRDPDDATAADLMRDLAQRILPVYQEADTDGFLANVTALQIVSGAWRAAFDSSKSLRSRRQGKPFDDLTQRAILDGIYARARLLEADERLGFAEAYARAFQELVSPLDNAQAQAIMARLETPLAVYREPLRQAFDRWRAMRVEFKTDARNLRVRGALLGIGASFEGIFRKHMILPDSIRDSAWYAIVDDDWPQVKEMLLAKIEAHAA